MPSLQRPPRQLVQHPHLVLGVDLDVAVRRRLGRQRQLSGVTPSGSRKRMVTAPRSRPPMDDGGATRHDLLTEQDRHPVRQRLHLVHVVGRQQHGGPGRRQPPDEVPGVPTPGRVEAGRRLVEEQEVRVADDPQPDVEATLLATGEPLDPVVRLLTPAR